MKLFGYELTLGKAQETPAEETPLREAAPSIGVTIDADEENWRPLTSDTRRDLSPVSQQRMRDMALYLWESNLMANRLIELPLAYMLAEGITLRCDDEENNKVLKRFWRDPINNMKIKIVKKVRELALYGEQCYPTFVNEHSGHVRLGYLDPAQIATVVIDPDNPEQPIGIVSVKDKKGVARRYRVIVNGNEEELFTQCTREIRATFADGEAFYFTINDLSNGRRGRSDLLAQIDWLDGYDQFLFGELDRSNFMRAFLWDVTLTGATPEEVKKRSSEITAPNPGSVRVHNDSESWKAESPSLGASDSEGVARLFRNHCLGGGTIPEHWFGGGGSVNRATAGEMGDPTFKMFSMRQNYIKSMLEDMGIYALRQAALAADRGEPDLEDARFEVEAIFPELTTRDNSTYAQALQQVVAAAALAVSNKFITLETAVRLINAISGRIGVEIDADDELKKVLDQLSKKQEGDAFTAAGAAAGADANFAEANPYHDSSNGKFTTAGGAGYVNLWGKGQASRDMKPQDTGPKLQDGHHTLTMPHPILRETEKAVAIRNHALADARATAKYDIKELSSSQIQMLRDNKGGGDLTWLPKSQISTHQGQVIGMQRWLADKHRLGTLEGAVARVKAFDAGKTRYNDLLAQAKAAGVKGVRVGMRTTTIKEKMRAHGVAVDFHEADEGLDIMAGIVRLTSAAEE